MKHPDCIFCKIIQNQIQTQKLYEDEKCIVILDKFPVTKGQSLIISKSHVDYIFNLEDQVYQHVFKIAKKIGKATDVALKTMRTWIVVQGMEVPHVHIKLFPIYPGKKISLTEGEGVEISEKEINDIGGKIVNEIKRL